MIEAYTEEHHLQPKRCLDINHHGVVVFGGARLESGVILRRTHVVLAEGDPVYTLLGTVPDNGKEHACANYYSRNGTARYACDSPLRETAFAAASSPMVAFVALALSNAVGDDAVAMRCATLIGAGAVIVTDKRGHHFAARISATKRLASRGGGAGEDAQ